MRWPLFILVLYLLLVLDQGLANMWTIWGDVRPQPLLVLAVFVALRAPPRVLPWAMLIIGLIVDLISPLRITDSPADVAIIGPHALGYLAGGFVTLQMRTVIFRESVAAIAIVTVVAGMFVHLVAVALLTARGVAIPGLAWLPLMGEPIPGWNWAAELKSRCLSLLITAGLAIPLGWLLVWTAPAWGFGGSTRGGTSGT